MSLYLQSCQLCTKQVLGMRTVEAQWWEMLSAQHHSSSSYLIPTTDVEGRTNPAHLTLKMLLVKIITNY